MYIWNLEHAQINYDEMKKLFLILATVALSVGTLSAQDNCFERMEKAFKERGSHVIGDNMYDNIIISFFEEDNVRCIKGKVRVENGTITSVFIYYEDNSSPLFTDKPLTQRKQAPTISNGISEMIYTPNGEKFKIVFIEKIKPKQKKFKEAEIPDDF